MRVQNSSILGIWQKKPGNRPYFKKKIEWVHLEKNGAIRIYNFLEYLNFMEFGQIIYVVAIVAYFLYRATSKKKTESLPEGENSAPETPQKGFTFEELLREIREAQSPKVPDVEVEPIPLPKPKPVYSAPKQEKTERYTESVQEVVTAEGVDVEAESSRRNARPQFYEQTDSTIEPTLAARPKIYELPQEARNPYAELLKNPKSFRDAVVVSEILKPKHF